MLRTSLAGSVCQRCTRSHRRRTTPDLLDPNSDGNDIRQTRVRLLVFLVGRAWAWVTLVVGGVSLALLIRSFALGVFGIASDSMLPALVPGDYVLVNRLAYLEPVTCLIGECSSAPGGPPRGDVVAFNYPNAPNKRYIKRVIGLPGETITYHDDRLNIDGRPARYSRLGVHHFTPGSTPFPTADTLYEELPGHSHQILERPEPLHAPGAVWKVPSGHVFVLGDNRDRSNDSRFLGSVPIDHIEGRAVRVLWTWDHGQGRLDVSRILLRIE